MFINYVWVLRTPVNQISFGFCNAENSFYYFLQYVFVCLNHIILKYLSFYSNSPSIFLSYFFFLNFMITWLNAMRAKLVVLHLTYCSDGLWGVKAWFLAQYFWNQSITELKYVVAMLTNTAVFKITSV